MKSYRRQAIAGATDCGTHRRGGGLSGLGAVSADFAISGK